MFLKHFICFTLCISCAYTQELLNAFNFSACNEVTTCSLCALIDECAYCIDQCQNIEEDCLNGDLIEETPGCSDYESVSIAGFDRNEKLQYRFDVNLCETIEERDHFDNATNQTSCVDEKRDIIFWVKSADIDTMTFSLFAKLSNIIINDEEIISHSDTSTWPICSVYIQYGFMKTLICPNMTAIIDESVFDDEFDEEVDLNTIITDSILMALRELLPRSDSVLFHNNSGHEMAESTPNGKVFEKRAITYNPNTRTNTLHETYTMNDFVDWEHDIIPQRFEHSYDTQINQKNQHISNTKGNDILEVQIADKKFYEDVIYHLNLIQVAGE